jgi:hypothetical protein
MNTIKYGLIKYENMESIMKGMTMKNMSRGAMLVALALSPTFALAVVNSGSTGADGAFAPLVNTEVVLPPSGILNYTTVNIPTGVTVTFKKNATNTPVVMLASGNVTITGNIHLIGTNGMAAGAAGDGVLGDDGIPGVGAAGGYDGGRGGVGTLTSAASGPGGVGQGPGGGGGGLGIYNGNMYSGGGGGGFGAVGAACNAGVWAGVPSSCSAGVVYGSSQLLPLIGGSGGGGGLGYQFSGAGGGGGGGAILIASSGTVNIAGGIYANGGVGGAVNGIGGGGSGGGGAGGAIRIVATTISGNGTLNAVGAAAGVNSTYSYSTGGAGGTGRIRLESEAYTRTAASNPTPTQALPGAIFVAGLPTLSITNVGGTAVPAQPTGNADVTLPSTTVNPVIVSFTTTGVPAGNTVKLTLKPANGAAVTAISPALVGDTTSATASVSISLPDGPSTLQATVTYNIVLAMGEALSVYAKGEVVEKITLASTLGAKESTVTLITVSGKEFVIPAALLAAMPA